MADQTKRRSFLDRFLGNKAVKRQLEALQDTLEAQGIVKKEQEMTSREKAIMEKLIEQIRMALQKFIDEPPAELINSIIATMMGTLATIEEEAIDEEPVDEEEEEEEEVPAEFSKMFDAMTRTAEESADAYNALAQFIPVFTDAVKALEPVLPVVSDLGDLSTRMKNIEKQFAERPRAASKASETEVEDDAAKEKIAKGLDGETTVWGHKVKPKGA